MTSQIDTLAKSIIQPNPATPADEDKSVKDLPAVAEDKTPARKAHEQAVQEQETEDSNIDLPIEEMFDEDTDVEDDTQLGEDDADANEDDDDSENESDDGFLDVDDSDLIRVKVDGEYKDVTLGELKAAYGGEGAIQKRLKEATETRKVATQERAYVAEEAEKLQASFYTIMRQFDEHFFTPTLQKPSQELKTSNPNAYIAQYDQYEQEAQAIANAKNALGQTFSQFQQQVVEYRKTRQKQEAAVLKDLVPEVREAKTRKAFFDDVLSSAKRYGFTEEEVANVADHRYFLMARDAAKYHALSDGVKTETTKAAVRKTPRTLRSGNTQAKTRLQQADATRKQALERARKSGKMQDLVDTIIVPNTGNRRR